MINSIFNLIISLIICTALSGCTVNRVSILPPQHSAAQVKPSDVRFLSTLRESKEPSAAEGMISAYTLPIASNSAEKREALIREVAAEQGISTVVGLQSLTGEGHTSLSNGILVSAVRTENSTSPKFIAFLPPVNFRIRSAPSLNKLDDNLREHIQFFLSYTKGYYVHRWDAPDVGGLRARQGDIDPEVLLKPFGVIPDFIMLCDVDGYDEKGNIVINEAKTLKITLTLVDLKEKKFSGHQRDRAMCLRVCWQEPLCSRQCSAGQIS
ncbi:MAG TPA: hypothetical protein VK452_02140 [Dissulfurispiraceae bacterium]|nr:hypothetical protein [Dissulfurispiraceae bacterium]